jgi:glycosyltransferase involved in cell wall biosynthesis
VRAGYKVYATADGPDQIVQEKLKEMMVDYHPISIKRAGMNPFQDFLTLLDIIKLLKSVRPDFLLCYTIKPVIYGSLAARICKINNSFAMITGLGYSFMRHESLRQWLIGRITSFLYRVSLRHCRGVFFQNRDDLNLFLQKKLVSLSQAKLINGSGVDLYHYAFEKGRPVKEQRRINFLLIARLLRDKGIFEYLEAARVLLSKGLKVRFTLVGPLDPNPSSLSLRELESWIAQGVIEWVDQQDDIRPFLKTCDVYVLPSYREGTPRSVLEAMSIGRPIITTDSPGCKETIKISAGASVPAQARISVLDPDQLTKLKFGENGILVPAKDEAALATAMQFFVCNPEALTMMGEKSRQYAEERFDVNKVNEVIMGEMRL